MPKVPIDYKHTIIYKIEHIDKDDLVYVGHTTNWDRRKCEHKRYSNNENSSKHNYKLYQMIKDNGGWDNFRMIEVEKYPCSDRREADKRETEIMKELKSNMNMGKSFVSEEDKKETNRQYNKEYFQIHKKSIQEARKDYHKEYREIKKEKIRKIKKAYSENNKEKIKEYQKDYNEANKDRLREQKKQYRELNKDKIKEQKKISYKLNIEKKEKANNL